MPRVKSVISLGSAADAGHLADAAKGHGVFGSTEVRALQGGYGCSFFIEQINSACPRSTYRRTSTRKAPARAVPEPQADAEIAVRRRVPLPATSCCIRISAHVLRPRCLPSSSSNPTSPWQRTVPRALVRFHVPLDRPDPLHEILPAQCLDRRDRRPGPPEASCATTCQSAREFTRNTKRCPRSSPRP